MSKRLRRLFEFMKARAAESSTWRGLVLVATACGATLSPEQQEAIVVAGLGLAGLIAVLSSDGKEQR